MRILEDLIDLKWAYATSGRNSTLAGRVSRLYGYAPCP